VSGCDTGFGLTLAKDLHNMGCKVFAGCLMKDANGDGAKELGRLSKSGRMHVLQLDVTKDADWEKAVEYIKKESDGKLWGLVNNAGWATYGHVEWVSMETYERIININLLGVIRGTKAMLPLVRAAQGRVVTITSGLVRLFNS